MSVRKPIGFRATEEEKAKLNYLAGQTGMSVSDVLRSLVTHAEIRQTVKLEPVTRLDGPSDSSAIPAKVANA